MEGPAGATMDEFIQEPTLFDEVLRYGLYAGAVFQLVCIAAVIFSPSDADHKTSESSDDDTSDQGSPHSSAAHRSQHRRRLEKKKRR
ncbi:protein anon-73B1-like isoform X2 [Amphibalanus amphitrite]|uniref:protein anon-73B1-like isoform X1 n=2 Tax=Amphibalanus amphitrite TaxID=1232801 RepID=UPI001C90DEBD|nr:protein anon-73B1-like isoform X1 [Amphibalanus amphitrite]XP_043230698.1 protein anon-73B1-like isoform X2 [Amphibalanus amphitrite]